MEPYKQWRSKPWMAKRLPKHHEDPHILVQLFLGVVVIGGLVAFFLAAAAG